MTRVSHVALPIDVQVELLPPLAHFGTGTRQRDLRDRIHAFLGDMFRDLGIPAAAASAFTSTQSGDASPGPPYRIVVDGRRCRLPWDAIALPLESTTAVADHIASDLCRNRALFLTAEVVDRVGAEWSAGPIDGLNALLRDLVTWGVRIDNARAIVEMKQADCRSAPARRLLEDQLSTSKNASPIGVVLGREVESSDAMLVETADRLYWDLGLPVAPPTATIDPLLNRGEMRVRLNDLRWPPIALPPSERASERADFIAAQTFDIARRHAGGLLGIDAVRWLLDRLHDAEPALVEAVESRFDPPVLTWILRELLDDRISVRDLHTVLESLMSVEGSRSSAVALGDRITSRDVTFWVDWIRADLRRQITHRHAGGGTLTVDLLAPELEARFAAVDVERLLDEERGALLQPVYARQRETSPPAILTSSEVRPILRQLIALELPDVAVLSYQELDPALNIIARETLRPVTDKPDQ